MSHSLALSRAAEAVAETEPELAAAASPTVTFASLQSTCDETIRYRMRKLKPQIQYQSGS